MPPRRHSKGWRYRGGVFTIKSDCSIFLSNLIVSFEEASYYDRFGLPQVCSSVVVKLVANGGRFQRTKAKQNAAALHTLPTTDAQLRTVPPLLSEGTM